MRYSKVLLVALAAAFALASPALAQWPTGCVELNDIVEAHLGNHGNVGIYQRTFDTGAEAACQSDHRDDVRAVFAWAFDGATAGSTASTPWPSTCVALNDIVEAHLGNQGNVGIYQRAFGAGPAAESACQSDHRDDVRVLFGWVFDIVPPNKWMAISSGAFHTCALRLDGSAVCWGAQRGAGGGSNRTVGFGQAEPPADERFAAISSGRYHTCGLRADGSPVCWGIERGERAGSIGQAGFGQTSPPAGETFTAISSGGFHTCGLRADGTAVCWGNNDSWPGIATPIRALDFNQHRLHALLWAARRWDSRVLGARAVRVELRRLARNARRSVPSHRLYAWVDLRDPRDWPGGVLGRLVRRCWAN